ncbi:hypothetical protein GLE_1095 [Lysobacter enzymogenes]|uniref:Uncharacterized protein n=1 Tax=Lysobacter enzymogenes TaxID=69 RepID=A0A0S2DD90_LYSEN|nr:hotdog fold domain-containing protein [Lysobacter enzymogenes]ALN56453.1 hypothetical protein GLE_1095 [Lysobacter enzymogenes]QCW28641.1 DUF4442 domain-containing protein [Lysobacter enzymogenes]
MSANVLALYKKLTRYPAGHWLFSRAVCMKAPYFGSIKPRFESLEPNRCTATIKHRRAVTNHLGTVHAIAMCNLAELTGGVMTDVSIPKSMRWIPIGMQVEYLKKAVGTLRAVATPAAPIVESDAPYDLPVNVEIANSAGEPVFRARIAMRVSPKPQRN